MGSLGEEKHPLGHYQVSKAFNELHKFKWHYTNLNVIRQYTIKWHKLVPMNMKKAVNTDSSSITVRSHHAPFDRPDPQFAF